MLPWGQEDASDAGRGYLELEQRSLGPPHRGGGLPSIFTHIISIMRNPKHAVHDVSWRGGGEKEG